MMSFINTPIFGVTITIIAFSISLHLNKKIKSPLLNPILISIIFIICFLLFFEIDYEIYNKGGSIISFFLGPATVVLAVPLYKQIKLLKEYLFPILIGIILGSLVGIISIIIMSRLFGLDEILLLSLIPKSTTSAIAMDIASELGGNPSIAIAFVIVTGVGGYIIGPGIMKIFKINNKVAKGVALGTASHAVGTAKAIELGEVEGAMSSLAIGVAGLITVFLAPFILKMYNLL